MYTTIRDTIESLIAKFHSRKFLVWVVATVALFTHVITNDQWLMITMTWSGIQGALDWKAHPGVPGAAEPEKE